MKLEPRTSWLAARYKREKPQGMEGVSAFAVSHAIAAHGPVEESGIPDASAALAVGLYGSFWFSADKAQRDVWVKTIERAWRKAQGLSETV